METFWYDFFREGSLFAALILGIGVVMVLLRWTAFAYVLHVANGAAKMGKTRNRYLKAVKNAYDKEMLRHEQVDNVSVFVEREMSKLRFLGMSVSFVDRLNVQGMLLAVCSCFLGMVQGYYEEWDTQIMGLLLIVTLLTFVTLLSLENLLKLDEAENLIEVRMIDYLENNIKSGILMGERNLRKKERSLLLARQMEEHMAKMEMAAEQQQLPTQPEQDETPVQWEQEEAFIQMLNEFFG